MEKKQAKEEERRPSQQKPMHYELAKREMTEEELDSVVGGSGPLALVLVIAGAPAWFAAIVGAAA